MRSRSAPLLALKRNGFDAPSLKTTFSFCRHPHLATQSRFGLLTFLTSSKLGSLDDRSSQSYTPYSVCDGDLDKGMQIPRAWSAPAWSAPDVGFAASRTSETKS